MKKMMAQYPLLAFFGMANLFSWIILTPRILNPTLPMEPFMILGSLGGPTLAAVITTAVSAGKRGLRAFFQRYLIWRVGLGWWLITLFGFILLLNIVSSVLLGATIWTSFFQKFGLILPTYLVTLIAGVLLGPLGEEPGWRGFAMPRLQERFGPVVGSGILGFMWALWHLPGYPGGWLGETNFMALLVASVLGCLLYTWLYNNTGGSILLMILFHSSTNAASSLGRLILPARMSPALHDLVYGGWIQPIVYLVAASLILFFSKGRLSYKAVQLQPPTDRDESDHPRCGIENREVNIATVRAYLTAPVR